jgi:uncharacterized protein involved in outer membrane biogenesis
MDTRAFIGRFRRIPYPRTLAALAAAWFLYLLAGYFLAPRWIAQAIPQLAEEQLHRKASVGDVLVNPLLFRVRLRDFALAEPDGTLIVGFRRLMVDFELSSLLRWAWTFSSIRLDGLDLRAEVRPDGTFNLAALRPEPGSDDDGQAKGDGKPPRLLLQHAALRGAKVTFTDRTISTPTSAVVEPIDLELRDISTLPDPRGPYTVSAILRDGGVLFWRGDVSLHPIYSQGEIATRRIRLSTPWRFLRDRLELAEPGGMIEFSSRYRFSYADETTELVLENMRLAVTDVRLAAPGAKEPMLALEAAEMTNGRFNLIQRELVVPSIEVYRGLAAASADAEGGLDWQRIVREQGAAATPPAAPADGRPWKIRLESVHASEIALRFDDHGRVTPLTAGVADLEVRFAAEADVGGETPQARVRGLGLRLGKATFGELDAPAPIASLETVSLAGGNLNLGQRQVEVERVAVSGGTVRVVRDKTGSLPLINVLTAAGADGQRGETAPLARAAVGNDSPWQATLDVFELGGVRVSLADETFQPAVAYDFEVARAAARNVTADGKTPLKFEAALKVAQGGAVSAAGEVRDRYGRLAGAAKVNRFALKPLEPLISRDGALKLESGELSADVKVEYRAAKGQAQLRASGRAGIANFLLNESAGGDRLIGWKEITATGVAFTLNPDRLTVGEVLLREPGAKIVIFKDRSLNLVKAFQPQPAPGAKQAPAPSRPPAAEPAAGAPFDVEVERVRVENGIVDFSDLSLVLPFTAKVEELHGSASGISSDAGGGTALKLDGKVGEFGLANVEGTLKPFQPKVHTDIGVVFRNVEMVPLSPYSATFAGRRIATGRVSLDLRYKIENSQLAGDNRVVLERFTLGEQVESPGAMKLPYDLAIALLTDSSGRINVAVPVKGNVDDPQFSYGHLIWQAVSTVITNIVTAPFRALASLFGGGGENLENIAFSAGQSVLQPPEREKLKRVAGAVAQRPQLVLVAEGQYGDADAAALRERDVALAIAVKVGRASAQGAAPDPINPLDGRTQRAMEALFIERFSAEALTKFVEDTEKARGKPVDRANPVLAFAGRGSADAEFYQALLRRLNETARVPDEALRQLAQARSSAVAGFMKEAVPESRLSAKTGEAPGASVVKLSFDVVRQPRK